MHVRMRVYTESFFLKLSVYIRINRKGGIAMIKRSCEDANTLYLCLPCFRLIFREGKYVGWYRPHKKNK